MVISNDQGKMLVTLARTVLEGAVKGEVPAESETTPLLDEKRGVFVTLNKVDSGARALRGCIGFPYPSKKLGEAVKQATVAACSEDPRFPPVMEEELGSIVVEVSVLTPPKKLESGDRRDLPSKVRVGEDGLIVSSEYQSGLLLPQVATEYRLSPEDFLSETCMKAGLTPDSWLDPRTSVQTFQAEVFAESSPWGRVERVST
ncbi:MAG TPA: TIGR00296 family protein [Nitrososphaerales archaeon]|nr:TIGR00296 family protein [Nitrososphaerales archaeon]